MKVRGGLAHPILSVEMEGVIMIVYGVKKIVVGSLFKVFPLVFGVLGIVIGIFTFLIFPVAAAAGLGFGLRLLSLLIFVVLYTIIMVVGIVVFAFLYNWFSSKVGGVVINLEEKKLYDVED